MRDHIETPFNQILAQYHLNNRWERCGVLLTRLSRGGDDGRGRRPPPDAVHRDDVELVLGVGAEVPHRVEHGGDARDLAVLLVGLLGLVLDHVVDDVLRADVVRPGQADGGGRHVRDADVGGGPGKGWNGRENGHSSLKV